MKDYKIILLAIVNGIFIASSFIYGYDLGYRAEIKEAHAFEATYGVKPIIIDAGDRVFYLFRGDTVEGLNPE